MLAEQLFDKLGFEKLSSFKNVFLARANLKLALIKSFHKTISIPSRLNFLFITSGMSWFELGLKP